MKITIRQWRYLASRLNCYPLDILNDLNASEFDNIAPHYINLDLLIRDRLRLSLAEVLSESENVLTITEMAQLVGINRYVLHYRYKINNVAPVTTFPYLHFNVHDAWCIIQRPELAAYFKANPVYKWRVSNHYSLYQASRKLKLSRLQLTILESKGLHPSIYNDLKPKHNKPTNNKIVGSMQPTFADIPTDKNRATKVNNTRNQAKTPKGWGSDTVVLSQLSKLRRAITRHCGPATLAALLRWQRKKIR